MLESLSDLVSLVVVFCFVLCGIYLLYVVMDRHRDADLRRKAERFYNLYDELDDEDEENDDFLGQFYE